MHLVEIDRPLPVWNSQIFGFAGILEEGKKNRRRSRSVSARARASESESNRRATEAKMPKGASSSGSSQNVQRGGGSAQQRNAPKPAGAQPRGRRQGERSRKDRSHGELCRRCCPSRSRPLRFLTPFSSPAFGCLVPHPHHPHHPASLRLSQLPRNRNRSCSSPSRESKSVR